VLRPYAPPFYYLAAPAADRQRWTGTRRAGGEAAQALHAASDESCHATTTHDEGCTPLPVSRAATADQSERGATGQVAALRNTYAKRARQPSKICAFLARRPLQAHHHPPARLR